MENKIILKYLGFLVSKYSFDFQSQKFDEYFNFKGPIYTYSFYNKNGCFTLQHIVQLGEWNWYTSKDFSTIQYNLLKKHIKQTDYIKYSWSNRNMIKKLAQSIKNQINNSSCFFGIDIE